jgi:hypothetical protein
MGSYVTQEFGQAIDGETGKGKGDFRPKQVTKPYVSPGQIAALPVGHAYVRIAGATPVAVVIPKVADGDAGVPEPEPDDDDGTPIVPPPRGPGDPAPAPPAPGVGLDPGPTRAPGVLQRLSDEDDRVY